MFGLFKKKIEIASPMTGDVVDITKTSDQVFSGKMVGDGVTIIPTDGEVVAPIDAEVTQIFDTGHAIGLKSGDIEILIHIGLDTVELNGQGFQKIAKVGDQVKKGDTLIIADLNLIKSLGKPIETPLIIVNGGGKTIHKNLTHAIKGETIVMELK